MAEVEKAEKIQSKGKKKVSMPKPSIESCDIHVPFEAGCTMMIAGPTGCGKTFFVKKLLTGKNNFTQPVRNILYCYGVYQPLFNEMRRTIPNIEFHKGLPETSEIELLSSTKHFDIIVLDDLMERIVNSLSAQELFTKFCHHYNISTIYLSQNVFAQGKCSKTISLNTLILVLFPNHRDQSQIMILARQQSPRSPDLFLEAFEDATQMPYGYLVVDCTPKCPEYLRWRSSIFKGDKKAPKGKSYSVQQWSPHLYKIDSNCSLKHKEIPQILSHSRKVTKRLQQKTLK